MSEQNLPMRTASEVPDLPPETRLNNGFYITLDLVTVVCLGMGVFHFLSDVQYDEGFTAGALAVVGLVWAIYSVNAWLYTPPDDNFQAALDREATRHLVQVDGRPHLPAGTSSSLIEELAQRERWALPGWLSTGQGVLISLGLMGTFIGLTWGLLESAESLGAGDATKMTGGMTALLNGAKLAFVKSIAGVACGMVWSLRYRYLEVQHGHWLDDQRAWLERRYPSISDQELMVRLDDRRQQAHDQLAASMAKGLAQLEQSIYTHRQSLDQLEEKTQARHQRLEQHLGQIADYLARGLATQEETRNHLAQRIDQGAASVREGIDGVHSLVDSVSNSLPENIGDQTAVLLKPSLEQITGVLRDLANTGGQAIGDTLQESVGQEITGLQQSLANLAQMLQGLGPRVSAEVAQAEASIQQGAATAANALTEAGRRTSEDMRAAAAELAGGATEMQEMAESIRAALQETQQIASALRGAGEEVGARLRGVSEPLVQLPPAFESARLAMIQAQEGFAQGTAATGTQLERMRQVAAFTDQIIGHQRNAIAEAQTLAQEVERLRAACANTAAAFASSAAGQEQASAEAARQLVETVATFQRTMEETQRAVSAASQSTFEGAQAVTLQAARQVAEALANGASTIEGSLQRLAAYSDTMDRSLAGAKLTVESLEAYANRLQAGVAKLSEPLEDVANALGQVAPQVREATAAVRTEKDALSGLGKELAGQASALKISSESLAQRINDYKAMQQLLSNEWALHVRGIEGLLTKIKESWAESVKAADSGIQQNAAQLATYAQRVENALRLPHDLRKLDETLGTLTDVLDDLGKAVARA